MVMSIQGDWVERASFVLGFLALGSISLAQTVETVERSFAVSGTPEIYVRNEDGRTELSSHSGTDVEVRAVKEVMGARSDEQAEELARKVEVRIEQRGNRIEVETIYPQRHWTFWRHARVVGHIEIHAPRRSDLDVETEDGPLTVEGFEGDLRLRSEDGDVHVADCAGDVVVSAEDGDVELLGIRGSVQASLEDGGLDVQGTLSSLKAETEDGNIDIRVHPDSAMENDWSVRAEDGRVRLGLPAGFAADLRVKVDDGSIEIDHPVTLQGRFSNRELTTELYGGGRVLTVRTSDGSVRITKP